MGRKGSMNLQVITDSFVKDQSRRRNVQPMSARVPLTPVKTTTQRRLSSPDIKLTLSQNKKIEEKPVLTIQTGPKSAIPKASAPKSGLPLAAGPKSALPGLRISTLVSNKTSGPKTPLSATAKKNPGLSLEPPTSAIFEIDAPDTPVNVMYANAFFDNKEREDEVTEAINKKVLKQQRKENIRNMRRERMKQPKDMRVALILGRLYDASHYELGPLSYWSDPEVENNEELYPKEEETENKEDEFRPKKMISLDEEDDEEKKVKEKNKVEIDHDKTNNVNAHPAWIPGDAGCSNIACQRSATRVNGKIVKKNKRPYIAVASYYAKLYDPILMKKREEEEKLKLIERQRQNSIITELKPMGKSASQRSQNNPRQNSNNNGYNNNNRNRNYNNYNRNQKYQNYQYQNKQDYNNGFNKYRNNETFAINIRENKLQDQPNYRINFFNKRNDNRSTNQDNSYMSNDYSPTYGYGYVYQYPVYPYYDPNMVQNYDNGDYNNYGTNYGQNYSTDGNSYYYNSYDNNGTSNSYQNRFKPRMNYQNKSNNKFNNYNSNKTGNIDTFKKYEKKVNIKS